MPIEGKHCINCTYKQTPANKEPCCLCLNAKDYTNNRHSYWIKETKSNERKTDNGY